MARLLVVEDNIDLTNVVRSLLEFENHSVDIVHNGGEGLTAVLTKPYDLIILDWDLPEVSGIEILKQFRARGARTPVIMLTGHSTVEDMEAGLDQGADDYLTKPFNMKELGARVRAHIRRAGNNSGSATSSITLKDIAIDQATKKVTKSGRMHTLPEHEFQLLELAVAYPHIQPTVPDLLQQIWPGDSDAEPKLKMAVRRLRKKFDPDSTLIFPHLYTEFPSQTTLFDDLIASEAEMDHYLGTVLSGKYELVELIGGGGSGLVYRANHLDLNSSVALKILHVHALAQSDTLPRFRREAKVTGLLSHRNIVAVRDYGVASGGEPYLVMELVNGVSLAEYLKQYGRPPLREVIEIFTQACSGLEHAHEKGLVHRDIKPSNLMLIHGDEMTIKLVDFGLARAVNVDKAEQITQLGDVLGSPAYMSPEQARGEELDQRTDIYSLGCALYESLAGDPPFNGKDTVDILVKHITLTPPELTLEGLSPLLQIRLNKIVARCLAKAPADRFQSASQLKAALAEVMGPVQERTSQAEIEPENSRNWSARKTKLLSWFNERFRL